MVIQFIYQKHKVFLSLSSWYRKISFFTCLTYPKVQGHLHLGHVMSHQSSYGVKFHSKSESRKYGKKHDMSKVKCFHCLEHGHYATNCPQKKKNKKASVSTTSEALTLQFELDFLLISCMFSSAMGSAWYLDSGASFNMMRDKEIFSSLEERDLQMRIEMGDDERYSATGIGTVTFQRQSGKLF